MPIYFPRIFLYFSPDAEIRIRAYTEDRARRRKIRASRPIPLKVSRWKIVDATPTCRHEKAAHTVTRARNYPRACCAHILYPSLSLSILLCSRIRRLNLSPVDRAQIDNPLDRVQLSPACPITRCDDVISTRTISHRRINFLPDIR